MIHPQAPMHALSDSWAVQLAILNYRAPKPEKEVLKQRSQQAVKKCAMVNKLLGAAHTAKRKADILAIIAPYPDGVDCTVVAAEIGLSTDRTRVLLQTLAKEGKAVVKVKGHRYGQKLNLWAAA